MYFLINTGKNFILIKKEGGIEMRLSAPSQRMFGITIILAVIGLVLFIIGSFVLPILTIIGFILLFFAFLLLILSLFNKNTQILR
jgi:uncharacterized membrane protein YphA (DoxX/SURF4 family)